MSELFPDTPSDSSSALVVIELQAAVVHGAARPHDADFVVRRICALIDRARREGAQVVFVQHEGPGRERNSDGWKLIAALRPQFPDWVVTKTGASIFAGGNLAAQLKATGIKRLVLAGVSTDCSVEASCQDAAEHGFEVVLASDAHTTHHDNAENVIAQRNAVLAKAAAVLEAGAVAFA